MKTKILLTHFIALMVLVARGANGTNDLTSSLQKGLFEEEANQNLPAAIQAYQSVAGQFDKDRKLAATAIFRLGECYRKQGNKADAAAQYERILREFSDQIQLATLSRQNLTGLGITAPAAGAPPAAAAAAPTSSEAEEVKRIQALIKDSPDLINSMGTTGTPLLQAAANGQLVVAEFLLNNGASTSVGDNLSSPLHAAAANGHKSMVELLLAHGADVNARDNNRQTPLHRAAEKGFIAVADALLSKGAELNATDQKSATPLLIACQKGKWDMARWLLNHNADPDIPEQNGSRPMNYGLRQPDFFELLLAKHAAVNLPGGKGVPPLLTAIGQGLTNVVQTLLDHEADPTERGEFGMTPLYYALGQPGILEKLLQAGAKASETNRAGETPLHWAARADLTNAAKALLDKGADINARDDHGMTPLAAAAKAGQSSMVEFLLANHADPNLATTNGATPTQLRAQYRNSAYQTQNVGIGMQLRYPSENTFESRLRTTPRSGEIADEILLALQEHGATPPEPVSPPQPGIPSRPLKMSPPPAIPIAPVPPVPPKPPTPPTAPKAASDPFTTRSAMKVENPALFKTTSNAWQRNPKLAQTFNVGDGRLRSSPFASGPVEERRLNIGGVLYSPSPADSELLKAGYQQDSSAKDRTGPAWQEQAASPLKGRSGNAIAWTGKEMVVFGGEGMGVSFDDGARYNPASKVWRELPSKGRPSTRTGASSVWTGKEMIIWGGFGGENGNDFNHGDGARYNPNSDLWSPVSMKNAPSERFDAAAVWNGREMCVWGGYTDSHSRYQGGHADAHLNTGGRYDPLSDSWKTITTKGAPSKRCWNAMVAAGKEVIVWGGANTTQGLNDGGIYNPAKDSWRDISLDGAPSPRVHPLAVWTGKEMIIWGGGSREKDSAAECFDDGARYNPETDKWRRMSSIGAPKGRVLTQALWTGSKMIFWGGVNDEGVNGTSDPARYVGTGAMYDPATDTWSELSNIGAPSPRIASTVWTGDSLLLFGGYNNTHLNDTWMYWPNHTLYPYVKE